MTIAIRCCVFLTGLALFAATSTAAAEPDCRQDTFSQEKSCVYGRGSIGMAGIGNQIITRDGQMYFRRLITLTNSGDPVDVDAILFRIDDRRTVQLKAENADRPTVNCSGRLCTWSWNVMAPISASVLAELASAKKLVIAFQGEGRRLGEGDMRRGGQIFARFLSDIRTHESGVLETSQHEAFLVEGRNLIPYAAPAGE
ncbi:hypothetical protein [Pseudoxanthomonas spadix]|nr:hypothetical protein [Pseudoxanthomonas spadix]